LKNPIFLFIAAFLLVSAAALPSAAAKIPAAESYVTDKAGVITAEYYNHLFSVFSELKSKTGVEAAVLTVGSLEGEQIEDYAVRVFEAWGVGKKGKDLGFLILIAVNDRKMRIEAGYGLEGILPDAFLESVIREKMAPEFRNGAYSAGVLSASTEIIYKIEKEYKVTIDSIRSSFQAETSSARQVGKLEKMITAGVMLIIFIIIVSLIVANPRGVGTFILLQLLFSALGGPQSGRGGYWKGGKGGFGSGFGGFGGGGFGGFGGGRSGGGGASGSW